MTVNIALSNNISFSSVEARGRGAARVLQSLNPATMDGDLGPAEVTGRTRRRKKNPIHTEEQTFINIPFVRNIRYLQEEQRLLAELRSLSLAGPPLPDRPAVVPVPSHSAGYSRTQREWSRPSGSCGGQSVGFL